MTEFSASDWWRILAKKADRQNDITASDFSKFLVGLHSCPASSAGIERWFSSVGFIWSKTRNRLGAEKAQKLATLYRALRPLPVGRLLLGREQGAADVAGAGGGGGDVGNDLDDDPNFVLEADDILHESSDSE